MPDQLSPRAERWAVAAAMLLFIILGLAYSRVVPPFEKPDELFHYAFARHLSEGNGLPVQSLDSLGPWEHEGTQAPLYYFLVGRLTAGIDQRDFDALSVRNPRANLGDPLYPGNKNFMLYSAQARPLAGAALALHVGRWFSLTLATLTLALVYLTARLALPWSAPARVLAVFIVAAIPQFAYISSSLSNDNLVILVSAATIYWLARLVARETSAPIGWWEWLVIGALLGLAGLSKLQGLVLLAPVSAVSLWLAWRRRSLRLLVTAAALIALPALAIAGWWYWRNYTLYGDWLGAQRLLTIEGLRTEPLTWGSFRGEMRGLRYSFWGLFGWFNILLPSWVYVVIDGVVVIALAGFIGKGARAWARSGAAVLRQSPARVQTLLGFWAVTLVASMVYWATFATSSQGRLLFPALSAFAVILVAGLLTWLDLVPRWRWPVLSLVPLFLVACSVYALLRLLPAAYAPPAPVARVPDGAQTTSIIYDSQVELVGLRLPEGRFRTGEYVPITLYLRNAGEVTTEPQVFIQLLDENREAIGNVTTHPGWGRNPTSLWQPGAIYEDRYLVRIDRPVSEASPLLATVYVGFTEEPESGEPLPATDAGGQPVEGMVGHVEVQPGRPLDRESLGLAPVAASFDQGIRLIGERHPAALPRATAALSVTLLYEAAAQPGEAHTAFVHLLDADGRQVAGRDQPPAEGRFPTDRWQTGDRVLSEFAFDLPLSLAPGVYELRTGLYPTASGGASRLRVQSSDQPIRDDTVFLGTVEIE